MKYKSPLVFIHIPKTAGTSFRSALEKKFGKKKICMDYGVQYKGSSKCTLDLAETGDFYSFSKKIDELGYKVLTGHIPAQKYINLFNVQSTITFLREPVKRILSEYSHFRRYFGYEESLEKFYTWSRNRNVQARMLRNIPMRALGLVGITERYEESLELFSYLYGIQLPIANENRDPGEFSSENYLTKEDVRKIEELNKDDIQLYNRIFVEFDEKIAMLKKGLPYTSADFKCQKNNRLDGWAFQRGSDVPLALLFTINGSEYKKVIAQEYCSDMHRFSAPRNGYIGFTIVLPEMAASDELKCIVEMTGQVFDIELC